MYRFGRWLRDREKRQKEEQLLNEKVIKLVEDPEILNEKSIKLKDLKVGSFVYMVKWRTDYERYAREIPVIDRVVIKSKYHSLPVSFGRSLLSAEPYYGITYFSSNQISLDYYLNNDRTVPDTEELNEYNDTKYKYFFFEDLKTAKECFETVYQLYVDMRRKRQEEEKNRDMNELNERLGNQKVELLSKLEKLGE